MKNKQEMEDLFRGDIPLIDVRAPVEFKLGAFPESRNLPILDDRQREQVGICYSTSGSETATLLGHKLVSGADRDHKIAAWVKFIKKQPSSLLYCFRGGERSRIACNWLEAEGYKVQRVEGGYKALRQCLLSAIDDLPPLTIIAGKTGSGKTQFLQQFKQSIDLEGLANHRGSAFGRHIEPQPTQLNFENDLAIHFLKRAHYSSIFLEDEGRLIGRVYLPSPLQEKMKTSPIALLEDSLENRAKRIYDEYIELQWSEYSNYFGSSADLEFKRYLLDAVNAIKKRLGNVAHGEISNRVLVAFKHHSQTGSLEAHLAWITLLLADYYDPMYDYQIQKKSRRIRVTGSAQLVTEWLSSK
jgi:tRNA 2-selenouridine synthase